MVEQAAVHSERRAALAKACEAVGGETRLAELIGKTRSHVTTWKYRGMIPADQAIPIEKASGVSRHVLRPDLYPVEPDVQRRAASGV
jgi:DNA-binding transcriptional regulator YdaS (Cro superfamily)